MTNRVNPPPHVKTPRQFLQDKETRSYFQEVEFILFQLWKKTGGAGSIPGVDGDVSSFNQAEINEINQRLGSGDVLSSDETGFTVDLTTLTVDMVEA